MYALDDYHTWFKQSVLRWLDIAQVKAKERIKKAVEIDKVRLKIQHYVYVHCGYITCSHGNSRLEGENTLKCSSILAYLLCSAML